MTVLASVQGLLEWDQETMMPKDGIELRASQIEVVADLLHKKKISKAFAKLLSSLIDLKSGRILDESLPHHQKAALREWRRDYLKSAKLPSPFVKKWAKTTSNSINTWTKAKEKSDFALFAPHLKKIVELSRKKAELLGYQDHPYDALLDQYEPGLTVAELTPLFDRLKVKLATLLDKISAKPQAPQDFLFGTFSAPKQMEFGFKILEALGFDKNNSRLDLAPHPFCNGLHPNETRMTTKIHPSSLLSSVFGVIHEAGHGVYNKGLSKEYFGTPLAESLSLGIDESQSRWWEMIVGHSRAFWVYFFPPLQNYFPEKLNGITLDQFYLAINNVSRSFVRIEADEVTYSLHIIVRFEIEKALIEGSMKVEDAPKRWNEKMQQYLKITPQNDAEGCLQDIHWSMGGFGYFPTYTLGNLYAAQFFKTFEKEHSNWKSLVERGDFKFMCDWLQKNIHQYGREYTASELVKRITGRALTEDDFINYLENKYL